MGIDLAKYNPKERSPYELTLGEDEAFELAEELKARLREGDIPKGTKQTIEILIAGLGDSRGLLRRTFTETLGSIGYSATPPLKEALRKHPNVVVRRAAAKALKLVGDQRALPDLLEAVITDLDPVVQASSIAAMASFGEKSVEFLIRVITHPGSTSMQCGLASWGLGFIGAGAPKALKRAAKSTNKAIRAAGIAALSEQIQSKEDKEAIMLVVKALDDVDIDVRTEATILLGKINNLALVSPLLIRKLSDESSDVRKNAALSLMKLNAINTIDSLKRRLTEEKDSKVQEIINLSINQLKKEKQKLLE